MGSHRYYACPEGLIDERELPEKWGLIVINSKGKPEIRVWAKEIAKRNHAAEQNLLFSLLRRVNNYVPIQKLVQYDKTVNKQVSIQMKGFHKYSEIEPIKELRADQWADIEKSITSIRR